MTTKTAEQAQALEKLRELLPAGTTVYTILRKVSSSGMSRNISAIFIEDGEPRDITYLLIQSGLFKRARNNAEGVVVGGCGMDMGFHLVYSLSRSLYPDGHACTGDSGRDGNRCPSNDHFNDRTQDYRTDRTHSDGGYALNQRWL